MTNNLSVTGFNQLATEIILDVFQYLSCNDILYGFFNLNQRLNSILFQYQYLLNNFVISQTNFLSLSLIGTYIEHLNINASNFNFSFDLFPNLKTLVLSSRLPINFVDIYSIVSNKQFNQLNIFRIKSELFHHIDGFEDIENILFKTIFNNQHSLNLFECCSFTLSLNNFYFNMNYLKSNGNISSLSLKLNNLIDIDYLNEYLPNLKFLNIILTSFEKYPTLDISNIPLKKFHLTYEINKKDSIIDEKNFFLLINYIKQFASSLISLSINLNQISIVETNQFQFNGILLGKILLESMIKLKNFHFYVKLHKTPINIEYLLSTFQNQFWFDHNWSIGIHDNYLYTLPFHFDKFYQFIDFDHIYSNISNIPHIWNHIQSIELIQCSIVNINLLQQMKLNMPNLISIDFISDESYHKGLMQRYQTNQIDIKLNSVTTLYCGYEFLDNLEQWLIYILPNVQHLILSYNYLAIINFNLDRLYKKLAGAYPEDSFIPTDYTHFSNIKHIEMKFDLRTEYELSKEMLETVMKLFQIFENSKTFIFHFYNGDQQFSQRPYTSMNNIITLLNTKINLENYHINSSYNYLQLIRKE